MTQLNIPCWLFKAEKILSVKPLFGLSFATVETPCSILHVRGLASSVEAYSKVINTLTYQVFSFR